MSEHILPFLWMKGESRQTIKKEIEKIQKCGIDAICIESRPHPDFLGEGWWRDMDFIMAEAKQRKMKVWLLDDAHFPTGYANGLINKKYPERKKKYIFYNMVDIWGERDEVTINIDQMCRPKASWRNRLSDEERREQQRNILKAVIVFEMREDNKVDENTGTDLTEKVKKGKLTVQFPAGAWRVFVVYETRTGGGNPEYIDMLDPVSVSTLLEAVYEPHYQRYNKEFGKTFAGFFSDEPGFGNTSGFAKDERIGEKQMHLPWSGKVEETLQDILGEKWRIYLPLLWNPSVQHGYVPVIRLKYMEIITDLYRENFSRQIGSWCRERGVQYIGHVIEDNNQHSHLGCGPGHYFKAMAGQDMAGIDTIGCQVIPGGNQLFRSNSSVADGEFYQYVLGKLGESAAVLDPIKQDRCMCELFGAYGWGLKPADMKWIIDTLLVRGVNYFVPHAFSMQPYPDNDCPPHFYAGGNNPLYQAFAELMKYTGKLCKILKGGTYQIQTAILYHAEQEWIGDFMPMQKPARIISQEQIEYLFVTGEMLKGAQCSGNTFKVNGIEFSSLIIPQSWGIPESVEQFLERYSGPVYFIGKYPEKVVREARTDMFKASSDMKAVSLEKLGKICKESIRQDLIIEPGMKEIAYFHKIRDGRHIYFIHNESLTETFDGKVFLRGKFRPVRYFAERDTWEILPYRETEEGICLKIELFPYGTALITENNAVLEEKAKKRGKRTTLDLSFNWKVGKCRSIDYPRFQDEGEWETLYPVSRKYPDFSGFISYEKKFYLDGEAEDGELFLEQVHDAASVCVNGIRLSPCLAPPYRYKMEDTLTAGENTLRIEIATTLQREQAKMNPQAVLPAFEALDPTGLCGKVMLEYKEKTVVGGEDGTL